MNRITTGRRIGLWLERMFWKRCIHSDGHGHENWYQRAMTPNSELSSYHSQFIDSLPGKTVRILEVGAGPMTVLGSIHPAKTIELVATDILANQYNAMLARKGITPPVPTLWADAERLTGQFPVRSFDYVTANNCIDHCANPLLAIQQMLSVVKPGCFVSLRHHEHEAERHRYFGLHKWNFATEKGRVVLYSRRKRFDLEEVLAPWGTLTVFPEKDHAVFAVRREAETEPTTAAG